METMRWSYPPSLNTRPSTASRAMAVFWRNRNPPSRDPSNGRLFGDSVTRKMRIFVPHYDYNFSLARDEGLSNAIFQDLAWSYLFLMIVCVSNLLET